MMDRWIHRQIVDCGKIEIEDYVKFLPSRQFLFKDNIQNIKYLSN